MRIANLAGESARLIALPLLGSLIGCAATHSAAQVNPDSRVGKMPRDVSPLLGGVKTVFVESPSIANDVQGALQSRAMEFALPQAELEAAMLEIPAFVESNLYRLSTQLEGLRVLKDKEKANAQAGLRVHCTIDAIDLVRAEKSTFSAADAVSAAGASSNASTSMEFTASVSLELEAQGEIIASTRGIGVLRHDLSSVQSMNAMARVTEASVPPGAQTESSDLRPPTFALPSRFTVALAVGEAWGQAWRLLESKRAPSEAQSR